MRIHELEPGSMVVAAHDLGRHARYGGTSYGWGGGTDVTVLRGMIGRVTRVGRESVVVRWEMPNGEERSCWIWLGDHHDRLDWLDPARPGATAGTHRKLGEKPEDTDDMTYIGTDHPGIQWLWDDMGKYATGKNWCPEYDRLAMQLGIPGRKQRFTVSRQVTIAGFTTTIEKSMMARSQLEANEHLDVLLDRAEAALRATFTEGELEPAS